MDFVGGVAEELGELDACAAFIAEARGSAVSNDFYFIIVGLPGLQAVVIGITAWGPVLAGRAVKNVKPEPETAERHIS